MGAIGLRPQFVSKSLITEYTWGKQRLSSWDSDTTTFLSSRHSGTYRFSRFAEVSILSRSMFACIVPTSPTLALEVPPGRAPAQSLVVEGHMIHVANEMGVPVPLREIPIQITIIITVNNQNVTDYVARSAMMSTQCVTVGSIIQHASGTLK